ncbi:MAG: hypothetical protein ABMA64_28365 [Myxococcota bacterium]
MAAPWLCGVLAWTTPAEARPPDSPAKVEALRQRREGSLRVGDPAPDPKVIGLDGKPVHLLAAKRADRPLVLIFGSFT